VQREFHSYYIHDYYPKNHFGDDVDENIQRIRKLVYKFKDGINSSFVAELISDAIRNLDEDFEDACFIIIPASTQEKTDIRYRSFCTSVCSNIGLINAYNAIVTAPHEATKGTVGGDKTKHFSFDSNLYRDKHVILFDDVRTSGTTFKQVLAKIINSGASNVTGLFLAKTVSYLN
jgi:ATP-dependent DNA helicase RecQ